MPILIQNGNANPNNVTGNPASTTVTADLLNTDTVAKPVTVTFTNEGLCATAGAPPAQVTVPAAVGPTPGFAQVTRRVDLNGTGARPCVTAIDIKVWIGRVGGPSGPEDMTVALVSML